MATPHPSDLPPVPPLRGFSHVALTVRDLERSVAWYVDVLGFAPLFPYDTEAFQRRVLLHPSGAALALTQHAGAASEDFDPRRTGLDHLALAVRTVDDVRAWAERLTAAGVEHSGVSETPQTGSALVAFRDPDGVQLEVYAQVGMPTPA